MIGSIIQRSKKLKTYITVCLCGAIGMCIQILVFNILRHFIHYSIANGIAIELATISNFFANNFVSFRHRRHDGSNSAAMLLRKFIRFNLIALFSMALQITIMHTGAKIFGHGALTLNIILLAGIILGSVVNYFCYSYIVWRPKK